MKIRIAGREFKVKFQKVKNLGNCADADGRIRCGTQKIWVDRSNHRNRQQEVVLHEVLHAVDFFAGLKLSEETNITLTNGLLAVMRDNPKFVRFLTRP